MIKNIKTMRYQIIKPLDCDWKQFGQILRDINYETRQILNKTIQFAWEYEGFSSDYKKEFDKYPKTKDFLNYASVHGYAYNKLKTEYIKLNSGNLAQTIKRATDKFKSDRLDILKGNKSIPNYKKDCPMDVVKGSIQLYYEDKSYMANLSLISNTFKKELERKSGQFLVLLKVGDNTQKVILDRIINGEYSLSASQIINRKNKWFLNLTYQFETEKKELNNNRILGIDLGIVNVATMQIYDAEKNKYDWLKYNQCVLDGKELIHFRQKIEARKRSLQKQSKVAGSGRVGHGYNTRMKPLLTSNDKIAKFRDTYNHKVSKYIVEFALKNECGVIQMENLAGFKGEGCNLLENWSYYDLQNKIQYKAKEYGIETVFINPKCTSQRCHVCGNIDKNNRDIKKNQAKFKCTKCGYEGNADINAARNISIQHIEEIIADYIENNKVS